MTRSEPRPARRRSDQPILFAVLIAAGAVLAAPVAGRYGPELAAQALAVIAAIAGTASFVLAAIQSFRSLDDVSPGGES